MTPTPTDPTPRSRIPLLVVAVAAIVVLIDQAAKALAVANLEGRPAQELLGPLLSLTFVRNPGAAFGLGEDLTWVFTIAAAIAVPAILWIARRVRHLGWAVALGLILGGALGNFIDRWAQPPGGGSGHVVDFLMLPNWPVFNVADMAVVGGAALAVLLSLRDIGLSGKNPPAQHRQPPGPGAAPDSADAAGRTAPGSANG